MKPVWLNFLPLILRNKIKERHDLPSIFENTGWLFADKVVRMGIGLIVNIWVARYLGPDRFGLLSYSQSFVFLFVAISSLGLDSIVIRDLVRDESDRDSLIGTAFVLKFAGTVISLILLVLASLFTKNTSDTNLLIFLIASAGLFQCFNVIDFYFQAKMISRYAVWANLLAVVISATTKVVLIAVKAPLVAFATVFIIESLLVAIGLILFYLSNRLSIRNWKFRSPVARSLLKQSWPMIISAVAISLGMRIDQVLLQNMLGAREVGIYSAAVTLAEPLNLVGVIAAQGIFPFIVRTDSRETLNNCLLSFTRYTAIVIILLSLVIMSCSSKLIGMTFGNSYLLAVMPLMILVWTPLMSFMSIVSNSYYVICNMTKLIAFRQTSLLLLNLILNIFLIPKYGAIGAAVTTLLCDFFLAFLVEIFSSRTREILRIKLMAFYLLRPATGSIR